MRDGFKRLRKKSGKGWIAVGAASAITLATLLPTTTHIVKANGQESRETVPTYSRVENWKANSVSDIQQAVGHVALGEDYIIRWGDTLSGISYVVDVSIADLAQANHIKNVDLIFAGESLVIDKGQLEEILGRKPQSSDYNVGRVTAPARAPQSEEQIENLAQVNQVKEATEKSTDNTTKKEIEPQADESDVAVETVENNKNIVEFKFNKDDLASLLETHNNAFGDQGQIVPTESANEGVTSEDPIKEVVEDEIAEETRVEEELIEEEIIEEEIMEEEVIEDNSVVEEETEETVEDEGNKEEVAKDATDKEEVVEDDNEIPSVEGDTVVQKRTEEPEKEINRVTTFVTEIPEFSLPENIAVTLGETVEEILETLEIPAEEETTEDTTESEQDSKNEEESKTEEVKKETDSESETPSAEAVEEVDAEDEEPEGQTKETVKKEIVKTTTPIHFGVQYIEDPELEIGEELTVQEGKDGQRVVISERIYSGEELVEETVVNDETMEATNKIIAVGSKEPDVVEVQQITTEAVINPGYIRRPVSDLEKGIERVVSEGLSGTRLRTYEVTFVNGEETERKLIENTVSQVPEDRVVEYGIKPVVRVIQETREETVPYETVTVYNDNVAAGESRVTREGQNGTRQIVEDVTTTDGTDTGREVVSTEVTVEPVDEIIEVGTQVTETKTETETTAIPFETEYTTDDNLLEGENRVVTAGKNGVETTTYEVTYVNGDETDRREVSKEVTTQPVNKVIANGTKKFSSSGATVRNVVYAVEHGDTLWSIAQDFGTTTSAIANTSGINENTPLYSGQQLTIPSTTAKPMDNPQAYDGRQVVYLDPGHGGSDNGADGFGVTEEELNMQLYQMLKAELQSRGYEVISSRETDEYVSLTARSLDANASDADVFVSMHHNAFNGSAHGIETFYYEYYTSNPSHYNSDNHNDAQRIANSAYLAELIQNNLVEETGAYDRGVKRNTFAVLRETDIPSVLIEYGFIDNQTENQKLQSTSYQQKLTKAVADAIDTYFTTVHQ